MAENRLYILAVELLEAVIDEFAVSGQSLPPRQYVSNGDVAFDCEQVVVQLERVYSGLPGVEQGRRVLVPRLQSAQFAAFVVRCAPVQDAKGNPPADDRIEGSAIELYTDMNILWRVIGRIWPDCRDAAIGSVDTIGPSGGFVATVGHVAVQVQ